MRLKNFLLNEKYIKEKYLLSDFKFGFELECCIQAGKKDKALSGLTALFGSKSLFGSDGSIRREHPDDITLEMKSEVYQMLPTNMNKVIQGLSKLNDIGVYTNNSCGFHVHLSFPNYSREDAAWIILNIAANEEFKTKILKFNSIQFFDKKFAKADFLKIIKNILIDIDELRTKEKDTKEAFNKLNELLNSSKYRTFRIHPQGTIEWRGPRDFLNKPNLQEIKDFFQLFIDFINFIREILDKNKISNYNFTKDDLNLIELENISMPKDDDRKFFKKQDGRISTMFVSKYKDSIEYMKDVNVSIKENNMWLISSGTFRFKDNKEIKDIEFIPGNGKQIKINGGKFKNAIFGENVYFKDISVDSSKINSSFCISSKINNCIVNSNTILTSSEITNSHIVFLQMSNCKIINSELRPIKDSSVQSSEFTNCIFKYGNVNLDKCKLIDTKLAKNMKYNSCTFIRSEQVN